jgi:hypothetical protein
MTPLSLGPVGGQSIVAGAASRDATWIVTPESRSDSSTMDGHRDLPPPSHDRNSRQCPGRWCLPLSASSWAGNRLRVMGDTGYGGLIVFRKVCLGGAPGEALESSYPWTGRDETS